MLGAMGKDSFVPLLPYMPRHDERNRDDQAAHRNQNRIGEACRNTGDDAWLFGHDGLLGLVDVES